MLRRSKMSLIECKTEFKTEAKAEALPDMLVELQNLKQKCKDLEEENRVWRDAQDYWFNKCVDHAKERKQSDDSMHRWIADLQGEKSSLQDELDQANEDLEEANDNLQRAKTREGNQTRASQAKAQEVGRLTDLNREIGGLIKSAIMINDF